TATQKHKIHKENVLRAFCASLWLLRLNKNWIRIKPEIAPRVFAFWVHGRLKVGCAGTPNAKVNVALQPWNCGGHFTNVAGTTRVLFSKARENPGCFVVVEVSILYGSAHVTDDEVHVIDFWAIAVRILSGENSVAYRNLHIRSFGAGERSTHA